MLSSERTQGTAEGGAVAPKHENKEVTKKKPKPVSVRLGKFKIALAGDDDIVIKTPSVVRVTIVPYNRESKKDTTKIPQSHSPRGDLSPSNSGSHKTRHPHKDTDAPKIHVSGDPSTGHHHHAPALSLSAPTQSAEAKNSGNEVQEIKKKRLSKEVRIQNPEDKDLHQAIAEAREAARKELAAEVAFGERLQKEKERKEKEKKEKDKKEKEKKEKDKKEKEQKDKERKEQDKKEAQAKELKRVTDTLMKGNLAKALMMQMVSHANRKWKEPDEAVVPQLPWRLYPFKGDTPLQTIAINNKSSYLFGRDLELVDIPEYHASVDDQHAILVYRKTYVGDGETEKPYLMDLGSENGTYINNERIEPNRYVELLPEDVFQLGNSTRDYVLLHDAMKKLRK